MGMLAPFMWVAVFVWFVIDMVSFAFVDRDFGVSPIAKRMIGSA